MKHPVDHGPIYAETLQGSSSWLVEPWNTISNLIFLLVLLYFGKQLAKKWKLLPFTSTLLVLLFMGFTGGTIYHATRSHFVWLLLDFVPIALITMSGAWYFWFCLVESKLLATALLAIVVVSSRVFLSSLGLPDSMRISFGYLSIGLMIVLPAALLSWRRGGRGSWHLVLALASCVVAVLFRMADSSWGGEVFPMGTHFLWHFFGGIATFAMFNYLYILEEERGRKKVLLMS